MKKREWINNQWRELCPYCQDEWYNCEIWIETESEFFMESQSEEKEYTKIIN